MNSFFEWLFIIFTIHDDTARIILLAFLCVCLFCLVLRIVLCFGYQAQAALFSFQAKPITVKPELKNLKNGLLHRIMREYSSLAENNIANIDVEALTSKQMLRLNFLGWAYPSMARFVASFELALPLIGILLAVIIPEAQYAFGLVTVASFLILKLGEAIFDFKLVSEKLSADLAGYIARELGRFYGNDIGSVLLKLKSELSAAITLQSQSLEKSIGKLADNVGGALNLSMQELTANMNSYLNRLEAPLEGWQKAIVESEAAQLKIHSILQDAETLTTQRISQKELEYIEANQQNLEKSMQQFELAIKGLTQELGEALGSIVNYHAQSSYAALNENLQEPVKQIVNSNKELIMRMDMLFERMLLQSRDQAQAILKIKEQMEFQFESLHEKLGKGGGPWI